MAKIENLGTVVLTAGVAAEVEKNGRDFNYGTLNALKRHLVGDWGDVAEEDGKLNDADLELLNAGGNTRVLSSYHVGEEKTKIWIITEGDLENRVTTILFPSEY